MSDRQYQIVRAQRISKSLGFYTAARYMCIRGWSIEAARYVLLGA